MVNIQGPWPVITAPEHATRPRLTPLPVNAVQPNTPSARARNDTGNGATNKGAGAYILAPPPDLDRPTGPPPAFEANLLEAEAARRRAGDLGQEKEVAAEPVASEPTAQQAGTPAGWQISDTHQGKCLIDISV